MVKITLALNYTTFPQNIRSYVIDFFLFRSTPGLVFANGLLQARISTNWSWSWLRQFNEKGVMQLAYTRRRTVLFLLYVHVTGR